ncbi:MAG: polyprenol monophosphomannose synthase [Acidobacteriota bacterium]
MTALVLVPTYNERDNLPELVRQILSHAGTRVLVIDDASPDGTGAVADAIAAESGGRVEVLHREGRRGLGVSYLDGFRRAIASDADVVVQMDADLSHDPAHLPALVAATASYDLVVGSRYGRSGGRIENWPLHRVLLSAFANGYIRRVTGLDVHDCTSGYRCWRREALARLPLEDIRAEGYSFLVEVIFFAARAGVRLGEVPIVFVERRAGASKLTARILTESLLTPWRLAWRYGRLRRREGAR